MNRFFSKRVKAAGSGSGSGSGLGRTVYITAGCGDAPAPVPVNLAQYSSVIGDSTPITFGAFGTGATPATSPAPMMLLFGSVAGSHVAQTASQTGFQNNAACFAFGTDSTSYRTPPYNCPAGTWTVKI